MTKAKFEAIETALTERRLNGSINAKSLPLELKDTQYVGEEIRPPRTCENTRCESPVKNVVEEDNRLFIECYNTEHGPHETSLPREDYVFYDLVWDPIFQRIAGRLDRDLSCVDETTLPRYVSAYTEDNLQVILLIAPANLEQTVLAIYAEALRDDQPTLLIVPDEEIEDYLELQSLVATGSLAFTIPFSVLSDDVEYLKKPVEAMEEIRELEHEFLTTYIDEETHPVVRRVNSNPRYILTELNHMRLLRVNKELPQSSGTRLEKVGEAALSHLVATYPDAGGEDSRGKKLPDTLFYLSQIAPDPEDKYNPVIGVVDSKSGDEGNFGKESIEGKHTNYLERARRFLEGNHIAHVFIVNEIDGQQDIEFYDEMKPHYEKGEDNVCLVIMYADALAMLLTGALVVSIRNDMQLLDVDFQKIIYPLFVDGAFEHTEVSTISRDVGKKQEKYDQNYLQRTGLHVITKEVVKRRFQNCAKSPKQLKSDLEDYFGDIPITGDSY